VARPLPTVLLATLAAVTTALGLLPAATAHGAAAPQRPGQTFTLAWGGDLTPGSDYGLPPAAGRGMLAAIADRLRSADIATVNLEGTLGLGGPAKCAKGASATCYAFQAPAANAVALSDPGIDVVNLANNHAFDYGAIGARLTLDALRRHGIRSTGGPGQIAYVDLPRARVAFLGFAAYPWAAPIRSLPTVRALVADAARHANVVVVFLHAGAEGASRTHTPDHDEEAFGERRGNPRAFAHAAVDAGADLVLGSGPHVLRGMELYRERLIAYSLGNLAGYENFSLRGRSALSGLLRVRVTPQGAFGAGLFTSLRLRGPGLPSLDPANASATLVTTLSRQDFGARGLRVGLDGALSAGG
jgi:hypothetical protein